MKPSNVYPSFGMLMNERSFSSPVYRYGFNGKEKNDEINVEGGDYDFGARIYDSRLGRWLSLDPLQEKYPNISPFNFCLNNPIICVDDDGRDFRLSVEPNKNNNGGIITVETTVHLYGPDAAELIKKTSGYSASGDVMIDGKKWTVNVNVTYVLNDKLTELTKDNKDLKNTDKTGPEASDFYEKGIGVLKGDNIMYIDQSLDMSVNGMASHGGSSGRMKGGGIKTLIHETFHEMGLAERYCAVINQEKVDEGFSGDVMTASSNENFTFSGVHLYDYAKLGLKKLGSGKSKLQIEIVEGMVDNTGSSYCYSEELDPETGRHKITHNPENTDIVEMKNKSVSNQKSEKKAGYDPKK